MNTQQREAFERLYTEQTGLNPPVWVEEKQAFLSSAAQFAFAQWQAAQKVPVGHIPMPKSAEEARAMALAGEAWLRTNAPEELRPPPAQQAPQPTTKEKS